MDDARALLNSLMGSDRDARPEQRRVRSFTDKDVCKRFLLGLCPNDLFKNTKMDLGACEKDHNEHLKDQFDADANRDKYKRKWRRDLIAQCRRSLLDVDRRIALNRDRIEREKDGTFGASEAAKKELAKLKEEAAEKFRQAEKSADDGRFEESREIMKGAEATQRKIEDFEQKRFEKYKKDNICDICGLIVDGEEIEAMKDGRGWHTNGRQHLGYKAIREKLKELEAEQDEDRRNNVPSPSPSPAKEAEPSHGADKDGRRRKGSRSRSRRGKQSRSKSQSRRKRDDDKSRRARSKSRRRRRTPSRSQRRRRDGRKAASPSPRRSRSRARRKDRSRSRRKDRSRSGDRKKEKKSPKRRSPSSDGGKAKKSKKADGRKEEKKEEKKEASSAPAPAPAPTPPVEEAAPPPPPEVAAAPAEVKPPEPVAEPSPPKEPEPDIDQVRPRVAFFMGFKPAA
eukprot:TRINITY_DN1354_c2_g1_i1.p1 TRINITY_DN1354_c2_g1~~TRINITY_DN1354_c2_g1_i1.p1  ORF type:complete len:454 (-),score=102.12 TRINITY_DN1354_c2_g1_i1:172-1533(-)